MRSRTATAAQSSANVMSNLRCSLDGFCDAEISQYRMERLGDFFPITGGCPGSHTGPRQPRSPGSATCRTTGLTERLLFFKDPCKRGSNLLANFSDFSEKTRPSLSTEQVKRILRD